MCDVGRVLFVCVCVRGGGLRTICDVQSCFEVADSSSC